MLAKDPYALTKRGADVNAGLKLLADNPHLAPRFNISAGWGFAVKENRAANLLDQAVMSAYPGHSGSSFGATLRFIGERAQKELGRNVVHNRDPESGEWDYFLIEAAPA